MKKLLFALALSLFAFNEAQAVSIDVAASSSTLQKLVAVNGSHLQVHKRGSLSFSGKYIRTDNSDALWEGGMSSVINLPKGFRATSDSRIFNTHKSLAGGLGFGSGFLSMTGGLRTEFNDFDNRTDYANAVAIITENRGPISLVGRVEGLKQVGDNASEERLDYRVDLRYNILFNDDDSTVFIGLRAEEIRYLKLQSIVAGIDF